MNRAEILELLSNQKKELKELERLFSNYKKDGESRKTEIYLRKKYDSINNLWEEIEVNNEKLLNAGILNQPYFQEKSFESARKVFTSFISNINERLASFVSKELSGEESDS